MLRNLVSRVLRNLVSSITLLLLSMYRRAAHLLDYNFKEKKRKKKSPPQAKEYFKITTEFNTNIKKYRNMLMEGMFITI